MKKTPIIIILFLLVFALGCEKEKTGISRLEAFGDRYVMASRGGMPQKGSIAADTAVYWAAVVFPEGYDWRRDTSYGSVTGHLALYKDSLRILEIPAGPGFPASLDPDLHHLVGKHLYTESCTFEGTVIARDGKELFSYPGRELLCGLLIEGEDVYTLGQSRSGKGFSLRRNGEELFSRPEGFVSAHISDRADYPSGALYRDDGHLYFSYWQWNGKDREWYIVEDGKASRVSVPGSLMYDIRMRDGVPAYTPVVPERRRTYNYSHGSNKASLVFGTDGRVAITAPMLPTTLFYNMDLLFLSFRGASLLGRHFYVGMNPAEWIDDSFLWKDGSVYWRPRINGFITSVSALEETP